MSQTGKTETIRLGFLTAIEVPEKGFMGGLLITTHHGRPLEFQCTLPVRPNSTQEILYGPTLRPYVLGELIGGTLIDKATVKPHLVLTDLEQMFDLRNQIEQPVVVVPPLDERAANTEREIRVGRQFIRIHSAHTRDRELLSPHLAKLPADADLREPFERVREALQETIRLGALR